MALRVMIVLAAVLLCSSGTDASDGMTGTGEGSDMTTNSTTSFPCVAMPSKAECTNFSYPEDKIEADLTGLCQDMPFMSACTLWASCKANMTTSGYCEPFVLVASTCGPDLMSKMRGCKAYNTMCAPGSVVPQCIDYPPMPFMPTTWNTTDTVIAMCEAETALANIAGCQTCTNRTYCPDPLASLSVICTANFDADGCDSFAALCDEASEDFAAICAGEVQPKGDIDPYGCVEDPTKAACKAWKYPHASVVADLDAICADTPSLVGCTLYSTCKSAGTLDMNSKLCRPFVLLGNICKADKPDLDGCKSYASICIEGSVVPACADMPPMDNVLTTAATSEDVLSMCESHTMDGCERCTAKEECEDPLAVLSQICWGMPGMADCKAFFTMCTWDPQVAINFKTLCAEPSGDQQGASVTDESSAGSDSGSDGMPSIDHSGH